MTSIETHLQRFLPHQIYRASAQGSASSFDFEKGFRQQQIRESLYSMYQEAFDLAESNPSSPIVTITESASFELPEVLAKLIDHVPVPEFAIILDGGIALEWFGSRGRVLSVHSTGSGQLIFSAWLDEASHRRGFLDPRSNDDIEDLIRYIRRVTDEQ